MTDNKNTTETIVEEVSTQETPQPTPQPTPKPEELLSQEQVNSIVHKVRKEEKETAEATNKELSERLAAIEKERMEEKLEAEIREKALKEAELLNKETHLTSMVDQKVNDIYKENISLLVKAKLGDISDKTVEEIENTLDDVISTFPGGVSKGATSNGASLNKVSETPHEEIISEPATTGTYVSQANIHYTEEEYEKLPQAAKELIKQK